MDSFRLASLNIFTAAQNLLVDLSINLPHGVLEVQDVVVDVDDVLLAIISHRLRTLAWSNVSWPLPSSPSCILVFSLRSRTSSSVRFITTAAHIIIFIVITLHSDRCETLLRRWWRSTRLTSRTKLFLLSSQIPHLSRVLHSPLCSGVLCWPCFWSSTCHRGSVRDIKSGKPANWSFLGSFLSLPGPFSLLLSHFQY